MSKRATNATLTATQFGAGGLYVDENLQSECIISLAIASNLTGLSVDTLKRHHAHLIRRLSPRRLGMKLRDVLAIGIVTSRARP